jgi:hypothetical protein
MSKLSASQRGVRANREGITGNLIDAKGGRRSLLALRLLAPSGDPDRTSSGGTKPNQAEESQRAPIEARKYWFDFQ